MERGQKCPLLTMLIDGNPQDEAKARRWVIDRMREKKRASLRERVKIKVENGKIHDGYSEDVSHNLKMCAVRRDINNSQKTGEIVALASFSKVAVRMYANRIGVPVAEMYRNPQLMQRMVKDRDYAKFRLVDNAAKMI